MLRSLRVGCGVSVAILVTISEPLAPVVPDASGDVSHPTLCFSSHASYCAHWTLAWHEVPGILTMTSLNYSHVHEPWVQKQGWKTTSVQCSGRAHSGELSVQAFLLSFTALRGLVLCVCFFFNAALQIEKKKHKMFVFYTSFPYCYPPSFQSHVANCILLIVHQLLTGTAPEEWLSASLL